MNEALTIAMYFLVQAKLGKEAIMPTNQRFWEGIDDFSSSKLIASLSTYVAENEKCGNEAFNVTNGDHVSWRHFWPRLASYFGAQASSQYKFTKPYPKEGEVQLEVSLSEWAKDKQQIWDALCEEHGVPEAKATWTFGTWGFQGEFTDWTCGLQFTDIAYTKTGSSSAHGAAPSASTRHASSAGPNPLTRTTTSSRPSKRSRSRS